MKFFTAIILTVLLSFAIGLFTFLPWWSFSITSLVIAAAIHQKPWKAFLAAFIAVFVLWAMMSFAIDNANQHILSVKVATILPLGGSSFVLILLTAFIGGLVAGLSALTGSYLRKR
jgi:hypothetical protein